MSGEYFGEALTHFVCLCVCVCVRTATSTGAIVLIPKDNIFLLLHSIFSSICSVFSLY